ncbi:GNAT family N-acetyltransferase [Taibaiella koreensis]|uniref:GNAT family N-acetyltransferase n=1 Tax=Taibaiella koreensis TaxID=1268548 RepID=UPI0013C2F045|nr:GNAT family N-acetyltransferase [Taibaiella koreensis]
MSPYLFTTERLGFRTWTDEDLPAMAAINGDPAVMRHFPALQTMAETAAALQRFRNMYAEKGYCFYAVETLNEKQFIGFIGLSWITYEAPFTPCTEIGWRLSAASWGKGYATEGAKRCLEHAFHTLKLDNIKAVAPLVNEPSIRVMQKSGMKPLLNLSILCWPAVPGYSLAFATRQTGPGSVKGMVCAMVGYRPYIAASCD